jgi:outer membrane protein
VLDFPGAKSNYYSFISKNKSKRFMMRFWWCSPGWILLLAAFGAWEVDGVSAAPAVAPRPAFPQYTLQECLNVALRQNADILVAQKNLEAAAGSVIEAKSGFMPSMTANASYLKREDNFATRDGFDPDRRAEDWLVTVRLTQNLYSGGGVRARVAISKLQEDSRLHEYKSVVDRVTAEVRVAFYNVLLTQANVEVQQEAVKLLQEELTRQKNNFSVGRIGKLNVLRAEVTLANQMPDLLRARMEFRNSFLALSQLLSIPYSVEKDQVPFEITGRLDFRPRQFDLAECLKQAEGRRPELKQRANDIVIQEKQIVVDRSGVLPRVNAFAGYEFGSEPSISAPDDTNGGYLFGISGNWQIFDGLEASGRIKSTRARLAAAYILRDEERRSIQAEVRRALYDLERAEAVIDSQKRNVDLAGESFQLAQSAVDAGTATQLDVLQARTDLTQAQTTELVARHAYLVALARLQQAISTELEVVEAPDPAPAKPVSGGPEAAPDDASNAWFAPRLRVEEVLALGSSEKPS